MTFEEIFNEPGKYKGKDFEKGYVFVVTQMNDKVTELSAEYFDDAGNLHYTDVAVTSDCFQDTYVKVADNAYKKRVRKRKKA